MHQHPIGEDLEIINFFKLQYTILSQIIIFVKYIYSVSSRKLKALYQVVQGQIQLWRLREASLVSQG